MPITIGSNIASLSAQRRLADGTNQLSKTFERLSSGQRINRAADDAAGLAISESLKSDRRVFNQGVRNFNDGISLLNIADGAIEQLSGIVIRLKELTEQAANGTYGTQQRKSLDAEAQALSKEYTRIAQSTKFNGRNLFDGGLGELRLQGGFGLDGGIQSSLGGAIGTGSFTSTGSYAGGRRSVQLGDLNGDGLLDMVSVGTSAFVSLGTGDGTFSGAVSYQMAGSTQLESLALGDVNGDGILDMTTAGYDPGNIGWTTIRLGRGDGSFGTAVCYQESMTLRAVTIGDLNEDGFADLVSAGGGGGVSRAFVRLGTGNGTFGDSTSYLQAEPTNTRSVTLNDMNGDGILDMLSTGIGGSVSLRRGNGDGTFQAVTSYANPGSFAAYSVKAGDLNRDGIVDFVTGDSNGSRGRATVWLGNSDGTYGRFGGALYSSIYDMENVVTRDVELGDMNGDGILDIVSTGYGSSSRQLNIRLGLGDGTFGVSTSYVDNTSNPSSFELALGDINTDGVLDIVTSTSSNAGATQFQTTFIGGSQSGVSSLISFKLTSRADALQAMPLFDQKLKQLSQQRGTIGAFQARIGVGTNVLQASSENYAAAESRIRDADIANESSQLTRLSILQQAASSVLAQANIQPQLALKLLGGA